MNILKNKFFKHILVVALPLAVIYGCEGKNEEDKEGLIDDNDTIKSAVLNVGGELFSIPSPIHTAMLIQKTGITYDKSVLSAANQVNLYSTDFMRALNLGIYGADLGYVSLYEQTQDAIGYLASIKQLSDKLGISSAFDAPTMDRIKNNITNKDSMMVLVGLAYRSSDAYLKSNQRTDISSLILAGGWVESMHFSLSAYKSKPSDEIKYRIAEQKQALGSLVKILGGNSSKEASDLTAMLNGLLKIYDEIKFTYNFVEPVTDTIKKVTYINGTTEVLVTNEQLTQIGDRVKEIRDKIINAGQS